MLEATVGDIVRNAALPCAMRYSHGKAEDGNIEDDIMPRVVGHSEDY